MATHDVIVIGASAGGVEAISGLVAELPRDLRAAVCVVLHLSRGRSVLPEILTRAGRLPAHHPADGEPLHYGRIYVAPPDHHLTVEATRVRVMHGPSENGVRPAIDTLFRSAARVRSTRGRRRPHRRARRWDGRPGGDQGGWRRRHRPGSRGGLRAEHAAQRDCAGAGRSCAAAA